jgi:hypothetical protein
MTWGRKYRLIKKKEMGMKTPLCNAGRIKVAALSSEILYSGSHLP